MVYAAATLRCTHCHAKPIAANQVYAGFRFIRLLCLQWLDVPCSGMAMAAQINSAYLLSVYKASLIILFPQSPQC